MWITLGGNVYKLLGIMWTGKKSNTFFVQCAWLTISEAKKWGEW